MVLVVVVVFATVVYVVMMMLAVVSDHCSGDCGSDGCRSGSTNIVRCFYRSCSRECY